MKRRQFLQVSGASATTLALMPGMVSCVSNTETAYGLQVYTIRDAIRKDFEGALKKVADIGYNYIELFGYEDSKYFGKSIAETRKMVRDLGLKVRSCHVDLGEAHPDKVGTIVNNWERTVADAAELGQEYIVCAYLNGSERKNLDDYKRHIDTFNQKAEVAKKLGVQFAYHNHDFEFIEMDGQIPYDMMLEGCDEGLVKFEMDLYWMQKANQDPVAYFKKYPGRFPLWHVKDMTDDDEHFFAPVGQGIIDWQRIFGNASKSGMEYFFVEQDQSRNNAPFKNIDASLKYLKSLKI